MMRGIRVLGIVGVVEWIIQRGDTWMPPAAQLALTLLLRLTVAYYIYSLLFHSKYNIQGKRVVITGGS